MNNLPTQKTPGSVAVQRRTFLHSLGVLALLPLTGLPSQEQKSSASPVIDGMGEIRLDYPMELIDQILAGGTSAVMITLGNPALLGPESFDDVVAELRAYDTHIRKYATKFIKIEKASDISTAQSSGRLGLIYYLQNAAPIQDRLSRLDELHEMGVRSIQLTYNQRNLLGDGCLERTDAGLSELGVEVVGRMNELKMVIDLSHCGRATTADGLRFSREPVTINHAGCQAVFDHPRNKTDEQLRALAKNGGVIGIFQINPYLSARERSTLEDFLQHVDHAVKTAGIDHVGIGSDREHRTIPDTDEERRKLVDELARLKPEAPPKVRWPFFVTELNHPRRMETIREGLVKRGYGSQEVDKIMGGNFYRVYK